MAGTAIDRTRDQSLGFFLHPNAPGLPEGGTTAITLHLGHGSLADLEALRLEIVMPAGEVVAAYDEAVDPSARSLSWSITLPKLMFAASLRIGAGRVLNDVRLRMPVEFTQSTS